MHMEVAELIEVALAGVDPADVEISTLEDATVAPGGVVALAPIVRELVESAIGFSDPGVPVRVSGAFDGAEYLISIADNGVGIPPSMIEALNKILESPSLPSEGGKTALGIAVVARLAARHGVGVRLEAGAEGTTARLTVPSSLVTRNKAEAPLADEVAAAIVPPEASGPSAFSDEDEASRLRTRNLYQGTSLLDQASQSPQVADQGEPAYESRAGVEEFLERIFGPLRSRTGRSSARPAPATTPGRPPADKRPPEPEPRTAATALKVRVPGANFHEDEDEQSVVSSEAAVDLRIALSSFQTGREDAKASR